MNQLRQDQYYIHSFDVDFSSKVSLCTICNLLQESAWRHASEHKLGYHHLIRENHAWVLSSLKVAIHELPVWQDHITLITWAKTADRLFAYRDFEIYRTGEEQPLVSATSAWLIVDIHTKRPQRMQTYSEMMPLLKDRAALDTMHKLPSIEDVHYSSEKISTYSDLDVNQHVNNVKYVEWILNTFSLEFQKNYQIKTFEINYRHEIGYNEKVDLESQKAENTELHSFQGIRKETNTCAFRASVLWEKPDTADQADDSMLKVNTE